MTTYRDWIIDYDPPAIPHRGCDWCATHPDYDGDGDDRLFYGPTEAAVKEQVDEWIEENALPASAIEGGTEPDLSTSLSASGARNNGAL